MGAGRRTAQEKHKNLDEIFLKVIENDIAGDPMDENIRWIKLTKSDIIKKLRGHGIRIGKNIVRKLLKKHKFVKRKMQRKKPTGESPLRDKQFKKIAAIKKKFMNSDNPIISMDTKKKEHLGRLHRNGEVYCSQALEVYDHDYPHLSEGKIVPHGLYDIKNNKAHITIGISSETAEFVCESIKRWWNKIGKNDYPYAETILIMCDAGGANSYRSNLFKIALQDLVNDLQLPIKIAHYPPYSSKWNPIEHRLFCHVTKSIEGVFFDTPEEAEKYIKKTKTSTGLKVTTSIIKKTYETGKKAVKNFMDDLNIKFDKNLGSLNYIVSPVNF